MARPPHSPTAVHRKASYLVTVRVVCAEPTIPLKLKLSGRLTMASANKAGVSRIVDITSCILSVR